MGGGRRDQCECLRLVFGVRFVRNKSSYWPDFVAAFGGYISRSKDILANWIAVTACCHGDGHHCVGIAGFVHLELEGRIGLHLGQKVGELYFSQRDFRCIWLAGGSAQLKLASPVSPPDPTQVESQPQPSPQQPLKPRRQQRKGPAPVAEASL